MKSSTYKFGYQKLWFVFIIGSLVGSIYETIYVFLKNLIIYHTYIYELHTGVIYGPFNIIYGVGAVIITLLLVNKKYPWYHILWRGMLIGGLIEYFISFLQESFTGTTSWNYSNYFLNINGRTTIIYMLFWGLLCLIYVKFVYPLISRLFKLISNKYGKIILNILIFLLSIDMFISFSAIIRQYLRRQNIKPYTFYGEFLDKYYTDDRLKMVYTNMEVK